MAHSVIFAPFGIFSAKAAVEIWVSCDLRTNGSGGLRCRSVRMRVIEDRRLDARGSGHQSRAGEEREKDESESAGQGSSGWGWMGARHRRRRRGKGGTGPV